MKQKDIGLLVSICVLAFLAVFTEKKVEVAQGYYLTPKELKVGSEVFQRICRKCHGRESRSKAPSISNPKAWKERLRQGMDALIAHALYCPDGKGHLAAKGRNLSLTRQETEVAVGYMIRKSREAASNLK